MSLTDSQYAMLCIRLFAPTIVASLIDGREKVDNDVLDAVNDVLLYRQFDEAGNEMEEETHLTPDSVLLSVALCAGIIAGRLNERRVPGAAMLQEGARRIVEYYGPLWLDSMDDEASFERGVLMETLKHVPEDLECIADLLGAVLDRARVRDPDMARLCTLLHGHASAQAAVAETLLEMYGAPKAVVTVPAPVVAANSNVVQFPQWRVPRPA